MQLVLGNGSLAPRYGCVCELQITEFCEQWKRTKDRTGNSDKVGKDKAVINKSVECASNIDCPRAVCETPNQLLSEYIYIYIFEYRKFKCSPT